MCGLFGMRKRANVVVGGGGGVSRSILDYNNGRAPNP